MDLLSRNTLFELEEAWAWEEREDPWLFDSHCGQEVAKAEDGPDESQAVEDRRTGFGDQASREPFESEVESAFVGGSGQVDEKVAGKASELEAQWGVQAAQPEEQDEMA